MRVEDIVGVSFFALLIPALVVTIAGSRTSLMPAQRAAWRSCGLGLISAALIAFGTANFILIRSSSRPTVVGNLWNIHEPFHRSEGATRFMITDASGHAIAVRCSYSGPGLVAGERARVRYVAYNQRLLDLEMLTGPYRPWALHESSGEWGFLGWAAIGVVCGFFAYHQRVKIRRGLVAAQ